MSVRLNPPGWARESIWAFRTWLSMDPSHEELHYPTGEEYQLMHRPEWLDEIQPAPENRGGWSQSGEIGD